MFFHSWYSLLRILVMGVLAYAGLVALLRISGKRTLSKMNAFDLIVTVAFGSTLATTLLSKQVTLADSIVAFALLIALQYVITFLSARSRKFQKLIKADPRLLAYQGEALENAMKDERVTHSEIDAAVREAGLLGISSTYAVVLETDGTLTVIPREQASDQPSERAGERYEALRFVQGVPDQSN